MFKVNNKNTRTKKKEKRSSAQIHSLSTVSVHNEDFRTTLIYFFESFKWTIVIPIDMLYV